MVAPKPPPPPAVSLPRACDGGAGEALHACSVCERSLARSSFAESQFKKKKAGERRCKQCVAVAEGATAAAPPAALPAAPPAAPAAAPPAVPVPSSSDHRVEGAGLGGSVAAALRVAASSAASSYSYLTGGRLFGGAAAAADGGAASADDAPQAAPQEAERRRVVAIEEVIDSLSEGDAAEDVTDPQDDGTRPDNVTATLDASPGEPLTLVDAGGGRSEWQFVPSSNADGPAEPHEPARGRGVNQRPLGVRSTRPHGGASHAK